jgi:branched-chain amino acid transport system substrate-binding protein
VSRTKGAARGAAATLMSLAMVAAACGGNGGGEAGTVNTIDERIQAALTSTTEKKDLGKEPASMEEWEALWAKERAAIVAEIKQNGWGKTADGTKIVGPEGFTVDLTKCPAGWSDTEGLTDTSIKLGGTLALSGTLADYGNYGKSIDSLLRYYGEQGAFRDVTGKARTFNYIQKDDGYDAARTIPLVDELLDSERVFAQWTLGTPATMKVYGKLNERCVPNIIAMTGHPAFGDPVKHPWTSGAPVPSYTTETQLWGTFIEERLDEFGDKIKVAALVMNNDFGKVYEAGFRDYIAQSPKLRGKVEFVRETIEPAAPNITDPMTTLAASKPDLFIAMTAGTSCTQSVVEAAQNGMKEEVKYLFQPLTCTGVSFIGKEKIGGDGMASDGWWIFNPGLKDIKDAALADDPWMKFIRGLLEKDGINPDSTSSLGAGFGYAFPFVQSVLIAQELDGGLTRSNLLTAHRALKITPPTHLWGLDMQLNGNADAFLIEGGVFAKFDAASQLWIDQGDLIDLDGQSSNCSWNQATAACE